MIHLAVTPLVLSLTEPKFVFNNIVDMQLSILECQRYGLFEKLISFSTAEVYGEAGYNCLVNEQTGFKPRTTYAAAKAAADMLVFSYAATFNINYNILRLVNNFGPKKRVLQGAGIIPTAIRSIVENQKVVLYGRGEQIRNFLNVRDTVDVVMKIINNPVFVNEVFLLADPIPRKMIDVIKDIFYLMGMKENIVYKEMRVADVLSVSADILKAKEKLSFEPKVSWFDGLNECIDYYSNHKLF